MKKNLFPKLTAFILSFGLTVSLAVAEGQKLFGRENPFTIEQLPAGELKSKLQVLDAPARETAMKWLHRLSFHEFDAAKHLRVDNQGGIYSVCSGHGKCSDTSCADHAHGHSTTSTSSQEMPLRDVTKPESKSSTPNFSDPGVAKAPVSIANPPAYNSRPGATYHIYLDFNGAIVTGKAWNESYGVTSWDCLPWSIDEDAGLETFNDEEQLIMRQTWERMAEDFAPFNVNVTTDPAYDPANYLGNRNNVGWILITPTEDKNGVNCPHEGSGGVAYLDVFGESNYFSRYQPAWTAIQDGKADTFAEVSSHEIGHNFGLSHDGQGADEYYEGHGNGELSWGPIMGASYNRNITQWSKGEYGAATEKEDDLSIIASKLGGLGGYRPDDHDNLDNTATPLTITDDRFIFSTTPQTDPNDTNPVNKGVIEKASDVDVFSFETGEGDVSISVNTFRSTNDTNGNNLDLFIQIFDSEGTLVAADNSPIGVDANISRYLEEGRYTLHIKNTAAGTPNDLDASGYSAYGCLGQYFIGGTIQIPKPRLRVLTITPNESDNSAAVEVTITGKLFEAATAFRLKRLGRSDILGNVLELISDKKVRVSFNITGAAIGEWDLYASNPSSETDTLKSAYNVTLPIADFFEENFDASTSLPNDWKTYSTTATTPLWKIVSSIKQTPNYSVNATAPSSPSTKYLESPAIVLHPAAVDLELSFWQSCNLENSYDGGVLEFSIDGGPWFDAGVKNSGAFFETNGYNKVISSQYRSPIAGRYAWSGNSKGYVQTVVNFADDAKYAGKTLRVRWLLATDNSAASANWSIDTVKITGSYNPDYDAEADNNLVVTSVNGLSYSGKFGGPFSPTTRSYTLENTGFFPLKWTATKSTTWVTLSSNSGTLEAGETTTVSVSINSNSVGLPVGNHTDTLTITNLSKLDDVITRGISVNVNAILATVSIKDVFYTYDGNPKAVTVTTKPTGLPVKVTYNGSTTVPKKAGIYTVVATIDHNRYTGTGISHLEIAKVIPTVTSWPIARSIPEGSAISAAILSGGSASVPGSFSYDVPDAIRVVGTHNITVRFTPKDTTNFATVNGTVKVTVYPRSPDLVRTVVSNINSSNWTVVQLGKTYVSPVVVATPIYASSDLPAVVTRIRNVTSTSFELKLDRADKSKVPVTGMQVAVVAVDEGVYTLEQQGVKMEAVKFKSKITASGTGSWVAEARTFQNTYSSPVVVGQVMSYNDSRWSTFWSMGNTRTSPVSKTKLNVGKHAGSDLNKTRANETIGYIVIESGKGKINGVRYQAAVGNDTVMGFGDSAKPYKYSLEGLSSVSTAAISQTGMDGSEGSWAVLSGKSSLTRKALKLHIAEDKFGDKLRKHTTEQVAYIIFE